MDCNAAYKEQNVEAGGTKSEMKSELVWTAAYHMKIQFCNHCCFFTSAFASF